MSLIKCRNCGRMISNTAIKCPQCKKNLYYIETLLDTDWIFNKYHKKISIRGKANGTY